MTVSSVSSAAASLRPVTPDKAKSSPVGTASATPAKALADVRAAESPAPSDPVRPSTPSADGKGNNIDTFA